jgi:hypothetical protein
VKTAPVGAEGQVAAGRYAAPFFVEWERPGLNVLKPHLRVTIQTLLRNRASQHEIQRLTGVDRKTIRRYQPADRRSGTKFPQGGHRLCRGESCKFSG